MVFLKVHLQKLAKWVVNENNTRNIMLSDQCVPYRSSWLSSIKWIMPSTQLLLQILALYNVRRKKIRMWLYHYKLAILILTLLHHIWCSCLLVIEKDDGRSRPFLTIHFHYMDRNFPAYFLGPHFIGVVVRGQNIQYLQCFYHNRGVPAPWSVANQMSYTMPAGCWVLTKKVVSNTFYLPSVRAGIKEVS